MNIFRSLMLHLVLLTILSAAYCRAAESGGGRKQKEWQVSVGAGLLAAPLFAGAKNYTLRALPDLRIAYKDLFFANLRDGIGYAAFNREGWRLGPVVTYVFPRYEKEGDSVLRIAGGSSNALQGMGDVPGTLFLGGFVEYFRKPYKLHLHLHKGVTGYEGMVAEGRVSYVSTLNLAGSPLVYAFGPQVRYGDQAYTNAYWGITPEQSARSGLERYHADGGITAYGVNAFAMTSLTKEISVSFIAIFDRLAPLVANSPLIRFRGTENQAMGGVFIGYGF